MRSPEQIDGVTVSRINTTLYRLMQHKIEQNTEIVPSMTIQKKKKKYEK